MKMKIKMPIIVGATLTLFALIGCSTGIDTDIADLGNRGKSLTSDNNGGGDIAEGYNKPLPYDPLPTVDCISGCDKPLPLPAPTVDPMPPSDYVKPEPVPTPEIYDPTAPVLDVAIEIWIKEQLASGSEEKREFLIGDLNGNPPVVNSMTALEISELIKNSRSIYVKFNR